jgi:hypothetical protein
MSQYTFNMYNVCGTIKVTFLIVVSKGTRGTELPPPI